MFVVVSLSTVNGKTKNIFCGAKIRSPLCSSQTLADLLFWREESFNTRSGTRPGLGLGKKGVGAGAAFFCFHLSLLETPSYRINLVLKSDLNGKIPFFRVKFQNHFFTFLVQFPSGAEMRKMSYFP